MHRRIIWLLLSTAIALVTAGSLIRLPQLVYGFPDSSIEPKINEQLVTAPLLEQVENNGTDDLIRYIIYMSSDSGSTLESLPNNEITRRTTIISRLQERAESSQAAIRGELAALKETGIVTSYEPLWIINAIAVTGKPASIPLLAAQPHVDRLESDKSHRYFDQPLDETNQSITKSNDALSWGIERIQAPKVWHDLGINGAGVTVAIVDTGVDLYHPDLFDNYRGNLGNGILTNEKNWFHTTIPTSTIPFDLHGHGTHVMGTAVGRNGIGVAPGAKWIAVAIADEYGIIYDSNVHAAFQWLLAPGGDPAATPDVVNNSWGGSGSRTTFLEDIQVLQAAGIITVFAAGNDGPKPGSVHAPGSYTNTISVGASDNLDLPTWFSGRGPSPLTNEIKPLILAPGTQILSALPGGKYGVYNGTSMATPHLVGTIALLLSANPQMTQADIINTLTETAVPLTSTRPNFNSGWGRLDAFSAVLSQRSHGILSGTIFQDDTFLKNAQINVSQQGVTELSTVSDDKGKFSFLLQPGNYDLSISAFGFETLIFTNVEINDGVKIEKKAALQKKPSGQINGIISDGNGSALKAKITVSGTSITISTGDDGRFSLQLPVATYKLIIQAKGRQSQQISVPVVANQVKNLAIKLTPGPSILLVDSGQWRYESAASFYQEALLDNGFSSDLWVIDDPVNASPKLKDLIPYEIVIWSAPTDSPGRLSLSDTLAQYLSQGGSLLISGQNVASLDGSAGFEGNWFHDYLAGDFIDELALSGGNPKISGVENSPFGRLNLTLNGEDSAQNQATPDRVKPQKGSFTKPIFLDGNGVALGLQAGYCKPYRLIYFGFGLEGVTGRAVRADLVKRSVASLIGPRNPSGLRWLSDQQHELVAPGEKLLLEMEIQNMSEVMTDTFDLTIGSNPWGGSLITKTLTLKPCKIGQTDLKLDIPMDAPQDISQDYEVTAVSQSDPNNKAVYKLSLKTPGQVLLVDDDRFFESEETYKSALDKLDIAYDLWDTSRKNFGRASPSPDLLNAYEFVLWFTGYDWHAPIIPEENSSLTAYLQQGGRLFLSSQDYLFYNQNTALTRALGVIDFRESITPTLLYANAALSLSPELAGPLTLQYDPYQNFSDGIIPMNGSIPFVWHNQGMPGGVANTQITGGRSVFWGLPLETLPTDQQPTAISAILGWLTDLGDSSLIIDKQQAPASETRTYTLTLSNANQDLSNQVSVTNTLPSALSIVPESLDKDVVYAPAANQIRWQGKLLPGQKRTISYQIRPTGIIPPGTQLVNTAEIFGGNQELSFEKSTSLWIDVPDLSQSTLTTATPLGIPTDTITYFLRLISSNHRDSEKVTATLRLPDSLNLLKDTLQTSKGNVSFENQSLKWNGSVEGYETITTTIVMTRTALSDFWLPATAIIEDGWSDPIILHDLRYLPPYQLYFPVFPAKG